MNHQSTNLDPALKQIHMYVCIMIQLAERTEGSDILVLFNCCKKALIECASNFPPAHNICHMYHAVENPLALPAVLKKNTYTSVYKADIDSIITQILHSSDISVAFQKLTEITE